MNNKNYYIYILTNKTNSTYYIGVTNNLIKRVYEHKNHLVEGFTDSYNIEKLIYFECVNDIKSAIAREKQLKGWNRNKKESLINLFNPKKIDLYDSII